MVDEPPIALPRSCCNCRPLSSGSGSPLNAQLYFVLLRLDKTAAGIFKVIDLSSLPASSKRTVFFGFFDNLFANTHPAEPAPTII